MVPGTQLKKGVSQKRLPAARPINTGASLKHNNHVIGDGLNPSYPYKVQEHDVVPFGPTPPT